MSGWNQGAWLFKSSIGTNYLIQQERAMIQMASLSDAVKISRALEQAVESAPTNLTVGKIEQLSQDSTRVNPREQQLAAQVRTLLQANAALTAQNTELSQYVSKLEIQVERLLTVLEQLSAQLQSLINFRGVEKPNG